MIYGERVKQARELCGLTQSELARKIGISQSAIAHIETGRNLPSRDILRDISNVTDLSISFFEQPPVSDFPLGSLSFRARASKSAREEAKAYQYAKILSEHILAMTKYLNIPSPRLPKVEERPETAAGITRNTLGLSPDTPIDNLTHAIEKAGVLVLTLPVPFKKIDAFSTWAKLDLERPIIVTTLDKAGERLRFSIAHELGHLVLHQRIVNKLTIIEKEADIFAAELLLPAVSLRQELIPPITLISLLELKQRWGVSIAALAHRARSLDLITNRQYSYLFQQISARGWRKKEPNEIPVERPRTFKKMLEELYGFPVNKEQYARDMHITEGRATEFISEYAGKPSLNLGDYHIVTPTYTTN